MGWTHHHIGINVTLSSHNTPEDDEHERLWTELQAAIAALVEDPKYAAIDPYMP